MRQLTLFIALLLCVQFTNAQSEGYSYKKELTEGWNLLGYYGYKSVPIEIALEEIWNNVTAVKDMDLLYVKKNATHLNTLKNLKAGEAYFVQVSEDCEVTIAGCEPAEYTSTTTTYNLTLTSSPAGGGQTTGAGKYEEGEEIAITAKKAEGYTFKNWTGDTDYIANANLANTTVTMPAKNITLTAAFTVSSGGSTGNFTETVNGVDFDMVFVKGGTYQRGCDDCPAVDQQYETPVHTVSISDFHIGKYEITNAQWVAIMGGELNFWESANAPKIGVSWFDANAFCCKLNEITGKSFRLLTDAEWEFAARGGNEGVINNYTYSGSNDPDEVAWHAGNSNNQAHDVGTKAPNELGIYDMSGNSFEWVYDWLVNYPEGPLTDPVQLTGTGNKTRRGGQYGEPVEFARVSRRAIRSRDGAAGMGFRIGHSENLFGMDNPCKAANPSTAACEGSEYRDCRLITKEGEVWTGDLGTLIVTENGTAAVSGWPAVSGEWYTLNNRSLNIVTSSGTQTYAYYVFSDDEMTMIGSSGMPYRLYRKPEAEATNKPTLPNIASPTDLEELISNVEDARMVSVEELANPDKTVRDSRLVAQSGYTWFMDGRCCGGNHKYRFHLEANGDAEFVVMDYDDTHKENILAKGKWFTVGNIALHIEFDGGYYNYLYVTGERSSMMESEYMPAGPIWAHISFQHYERGDFRIFSRYTDNDAVHRPQTGSNPVYEPEEYTVNSDKTTGE